MQRKLIVGAILASLAWGAAMAPAVSAASFQPGGVGGQSGPLAVPYVSQFSGSSFGWQVADFACGPASAAMVASFWSGAAPALGRAEALMGGTALVGSGSEPWQVAQAIRDLAPGTSADTATAGSANAALGVLSAQLGQGRPVVALVHPSWFYTPINHFVVVTGYDVALGVVIFQDPLMGAQVQEPESDFLAAWARPRHGRPYTYVWSDGGSSNMASSSPAADSSQIGQTASPAPPAPANTGDTVTVIPAGLRVHDGPGVAADVIAYLAQGDQANVVASDNGWVKLRLGDGSLGWVNAAYVQPS